MGLKHETLFRRWRQVQAKRRVKLKESTPRERLKPGSVGVVSSIQRGDEPSYEVEFLDSRGGVLDRMFVKEASLSLVE